MKNTYKYATHLRARTSIQTKIPNNETKRRKKQNQAHKQNEKKKKWLREHWTKPQSNQFRRHCIAIATHTLSHTQSMNIHWTIVLVYNKLKKASEKQKQIEKNIKWKLWRKQQTAPETERAGERTKVERRGKKRRRNNNNKRPFSTFSSIQSVLSCLHRASVLAFGLVSMFLLLLLLLPLPLPLLYYHIHIVCCCFSIFSRLRLCSSCCFFCAFFTSR